MPPTLINFTLRDNQFATASDSDDGGSDADIVSLIGPVKFIPQINRPALGTTLSPQAMLSLRTIDGYYDTDGQLRNKRAGAVGVRIPANDPVLGITRLPYKAVFGPMTTPRGDIVSVPDVTFDAPSTDTTIWLPSVAPVPGATVGAIAKGDKGDPVDDVQSALSNTAAQFYVKGTPIGDPLVLPSAAWGSILGKPFVTPGEFGAVGDGTANDTTSFQSALTSLAASKGILFVPDGTYLITSTLTLPPGVSIVGASTRGTVIKTTTDITAIKCSSGEGETLRDFTIRGSTFTGTRTTYDIWFVNPVHPVIENVKIDLDNTRQKGGILFTRDNGLPDPYAFMPVIRNCWFRNAHIVADNVTDGKIEGCWAWAAGGTPAANGAVQMINTSNGWTLTGNDYVPPNVTGDYAAIYIADTEDITVVGGYVDGSYAENTTQFGIVADNADGLTVSGFRFWNIGKSAIKATDTNRITVTGSNFADNNKLDNSYPTIDVYNGHAITVTGNTFHAGAARTNKGLIYREDGSSSNNVISGNALNTVGGHNYDTALVSAANSHVADTNQPEGVWPWHTAGGNLLQGRTPGNTYDTVRIEADGDIWLGSGSATADTRITRVDANRLGIPGKLRVDDMLQLRRPSTTTDLLVGTFLNADADYRMTVDVAGKHSWGDGTAAPDTILERLAAGVLGLGGVALRKVTSRVNAMSFSATPTFDLAAYDQFNMTLTAAITSATFSNGVDGQSYRFRFKDNATARAIALGSTARAVGITLPTTTVISKVLYLVGIWNAADTKMDFVGVAQEA